ncbi:MAG: hypothetical protein MI923_02580 [Phycisphaerales bacterium]|nr:hypothetical protein [Phycisphaerales bacterium]
MNRFTPKHHVSDKETMVFAEVRPSASPFYLTIISIALFLTGMPGCSELLTAPAPRTRAEGATPLRLANVAPDVAFDEGINTLKQYFRTVEASPANGRIESRMVEYDQKGGTGRIRDETLKYKNRMRRKATLWIDDSETGVVARCQVRVQRLDTSDHRFFRPHNEFDDIPNATPIDRDAGISTDQKEEWTEMPRDVALERELLRILSSRLSTTAKG